MSDHPEAEPVDAADKAPSSQERRPAFLPDEPQPSSAINEHNALSEREDGVNRGGPDPLAPPALTSGDGAPPVALAADEPQPRAAISEHNALSEREDGTNRG